jgi:hypothetical protein
MTGTVRCGTFLGFLAFSVACGSADLPTVPPSQDLPTVPPSQNATVSGIVWLIGASGITPYAGVNLGGWAQTANSAHQIGPVRTDAEGRYTFQSVLGTCFRVKVATNPGFPHYQPCVAGVLVTGNVTRDVYVIDDPDQLGGHLPAQLLADTPIVSGLVFEVTAEGRQPVAQAHLVLDLIAGLGDVSAWTLTDTEGRYVFCGLSGYSSPYLFASKAGYRPADVGYVVLNGNNTVHDIELKR